MKKLLVIAGSILSLSAPAQLLFDFSGNIGTLNNKSYKQFTKSYAALLGNSILEDKMKLGFAKGYTWGAAFNIPAADNFGFYIGFRRSVMSSSGYAKLNNGTRHFDLKERSWSVPVGYAFYGDNAFVCPTIAVGMSNTSLTSSWEYPDGTISTGREKWLNGVFSGYSIMMYPSVQFGAGVAPFFLYAELGYQFAGFGSGLREKMYMHSSFFENSDDANYDGLPTDYQSFWNDPANYDVYDDKNIVSSAMKGVVLALGIKLRVL